MMTTLISERDKLIQVVPQEYIHKPTVVEAMQIREDNLQQVAKWCKGRVRGMTVVFPKIRNRAIPVSGQDNNHYALIGDYVVRQGKGFVRVKREAFESQYGLGGRRI